MEGGFQRVDGGEEHPEGCGAEGGEDGFDRGGEGGEVAVGLEEGEDAGVGGCVAEAGDGAWDICVSSGL